MDRAVAIVADRLGWEERLLVDAGPSAGMRIEWANDESLCLGAPRPAALGRYDAVLVRSRSYTRGGLVATLAEAAGIPTLNSPAAVHACENKLSLRALPALHGKVGHLADLMNDAIFPPWRVNFTVAAW